MDNYLDSRHHQYIICGRSGTTLKDLEDNRNGRVAPDQFRYHKRIKRVTLSGIGILLFMWTVFSGLNAMLVFLIPYGGLIFLIDKAYRKYLDTFTKAPVRSIVGVKANINGRWSKGMLMIIDHQHFFLPARFYSCLERDYSYRFYYITYMNKPSIFNLDGILQDNKYIISVEVVEQLKKKKV